MARPIRILLTAGLAVSLAAPAFAQDQAPPAAPQGASVSGYPGVYQGTWQGTWQPAPQAGTYVPGPGVYPSAGAYPPPPEADPRYRDMLEKCRGVERRHSGTTGAVIGGVVGGVVGNRIASGNRVLGTVGGAAVGALAGGAIGKSIDKNRQRECEEFFSSYAPPPGYGPAQPYPGVFPYGAPGYVPYGYPGYGYMMVPVPVVTTQGCCQPCTETRTTTVTYVRERVRKVYRPVRTKLVKEKRVYTGS